jgi:hypothetical protein
MSEQSRNSGEFTLSEPDKELVESLLTKVDDARLHDDHIPVIGRDALPNLLSTEEVAIIDRLFSVDPSIYGLRGPRFATEPVSDNLVRIAPQPYKYQGQERHTDLQYVPEAAFRAYEDMNGKMQSELGRPLLIKFGYRSEAFQAITFLSYLRLNAFDVQKTAQRVAIPGYSEHGTPRQQALDFQSVDGLPGDETPQDFEGTGEFDWLVANAHHFDFSMSYPKGNPSGIMFEPWHWRHRPNDPGSFKLPL